MNAGMAAPTTANHAAHASIVFVDRRTFEHLKSAEIVDTPEVRGLSDHALSSWTSFYGSTATCPVIARLVKGAESILHESVCRVHVDPDSLDPVIARKLQSLDQRSVLLPSNPKPAPTRAELTGRCRGTRRLPALPPSHLRSSSDPFAYQHPESPRNHALRTETAIPSLTFANCPTT